MFHPSYVSDLLAGTQAYDTLRPELYLIKDSKLRKEINDFYKSLKDTARNTDGRLGSLADTDEAKSEQAGFDTSFQALAREAKAIREKLE